MLQPPLGPWHIKADCGLAHFIAWWVLLCWRDPTKSKSLTAKRQNFSIRKVSSWWRRNSAATTFAASRRCWTTDPASRVTPAWAARRRWSRARRSSSDASRCSTLASFVPSQRPEIKSPLNRIGLEVIWRTNYFCSFCSKVAEHSPMEQKLARFDSPPGCWRVFLLSISLCS